MQADCIYLYKSPLNSFESKIFLKVDPIAQGAAQIQADSQTL